MKGTKFKLNKGVSWCSGCCEGVKEGIIYDLCTFCFSCWAKENK